MTPNKRLWVMLGLVGLCVLGFIVVERFVFAGAGDAKVGPTGFDHELAQFFEQHREKALTGRVMEVSALGSAPVLVVFALLAYSVIVRAKDWLGFAHLSIAIVGAGFWSRFLQHQFERDRPENLLPFLVVTEGSFPSAHLFGAAACYATFAFFYARYAQRLSTEIASYIVAFVLIVLIGLTRIYLGAHHATDVIGGICTGLAWAFLVIAVFLHWYDRGPRKG